MSHRPPPKQQPAEPEYEEEAEDSGYTTTSVINAHSLFRMLLVLLAVWTLFEGVALATGAFSAVDAGTDRTAEQMLGGMMIVLGGVYAMLAWRRGQYRLLLWVPFAAQIAIVAPLLFSMFSLDFDGVLLLVISSAFLVLMVYVWWQSRDVEDPYDDFEEEEEYEDGEDADLEEYADYGEDEEAPTPKRSQATRPAPSRAGRFRKRDG